MTLKSLPSGTRVACVIYWRIPVKAVGYDAGVDIRITVLLQIVMPNSSPLADETLKWNSEELQAHFDSGGAAQPLAVVATCPWHGPYRLGRNDRSINPKAGYRIVVMNPCALPAGEAMESGVELNVSVHRDFCGEKSLRAIFASHRQIFVALNVRHYNLWAGASTRLVSNVAPSSWSSVSCMNSVRHDSPGDDTRPYDPLGNNVSTVHMESVPCSKAILSARPEKYLRLYDSCPAKQPVPACAISRLFQGEIGGIRQGTCFHQIQPSFPPKCSPGNRGWRGWAFAKPELRDTVYVVCWSIRSASQSRLFIEERRSVSRRTR